MRTVKLLRSRQLSPSVRELTFDPGPDFDFEPGQWVSFHMSGATEQEDLLARSYSIASAPRADGTFDIAVTRVQDGPGSGYLHALQDGSELPMTRAQGFFTLDEYESPLLMVATGTGVTPFRAMIQDLASRYERLPHPVTLLLGVRQQQDILYGEEFTALQSKIEGFRFVPTLSRPSEDWSGATGHVQAHVQALVAELNKPCEVYICGLSAMVKQTRQLLKTELNMPRQQMHSERFD